MPPFSVRRGLPRLAPHLARLATRLPVARSVFSQEQLSAVAAATASWQDQYYAWTQMRPQDDTPPAPAGDEPSLEGPVIGVLIDLRQATSGVAETTLRSLMAQSYDRWHAWLVNEDAAAGPSDADSAVEAAGGAEGDDARVERIRLSAGEILPAWGQALSQTDCDFVIHLSPDDELKPEALATIVQVVNQAEDCDLIYVDSDRRLPDGSLTDPFFKPDWSPTLLMCFDYVSGLACYRRELLLRALAGDWSAEESIDYGLALRVSELSQRIHHLPKPLLTRGPHAEAQSAQSGAANRAALARALARRGQAGAVDAGRVPGTYRVRYELGDGPEVTIIIPTRDKLELLKKCIDSVCSRSSYRNFSLMIIDNESVEPETLDYLAAFPGVVYRYPHRFNYARMMNLAAGAAESELILFLNNDCEVISPDWIEAMVEHCQRPEVGMVGVRLLYPDGSVHHEGITLGRHGASVAHIKFEGYRGLGHVAREVAAVTGACMLTKASVLRDLGGFDERMRVGYNDVDLCLRARERGYSVMYTGYAELYHVTGASRGTSLPLKDEWFFLERWTPDQYVDPYFSRNLTRSWPVGTGWA